MAKPDKLVIDPVIEVAVDGRRFSLRPSFDACRRIEQSLGGGVGELQNLFIARRYGAEMVTRIVYEGIRAASPDRPPEFEELGEAIVRDGIDDFAVAAIDMLEAALRGYERFNEAKLEDAKKETAADTENPIRTAASTADS